MKKLFCMITALFLVVCIGCKAIDGTSSIIEELTNAVESQIIDETSNESTSSVENESSATTSSAPTVTTPPENTPSTVILGPEDKEDKEDESVFIKPKSYEKISKEQQRLYDILENAVFNMVREDIDLQINESESDSTDIFTDVNVAFRAVQFDNPECFWAPSGYAMIQSGSKRFINFVYNGADDSTSYDYPISKAERDVMEKELNKKVDELINAVSGMDTFETEVYLHDYLCKNVAYTDNKDPLVYTSYGALVDGKAACEGYSRAMQLLCDKLKIPCGLVYGWSQNTGHMWNIINPGDGWYHLDITWDDDESNNIVSHRYFNVTKESITHTDAQGNGHIIADNYKKNVRYNADDVFNFLSSDCNNTALNYFVRNGYIVSQLDSKDVALIRYLAEQNPKFLEFQNNSGRSNQEVVNSSVMEALGNNQIYYYDSYNIISIIR